MIPTGAQKAHPHHTLRYYLILTTVVVGAIFLVLYLNDGRLNPTGSVTNSLFGEDVAETIDAGAEKVKDTINLKSQGVEVTDEEPEPKKVTKTKRSSSKNVLDHALSLTLDTIPLTQQENIQLDLLDVTFQEHDTEIRINNDEVLSLQDLSTVTLTISNFEGDLVVDSLGLSLAGEGQELIVNGVILSTDETMKISFVDLDFSALTLSDVEFSDFEFKDSAGSLELDERLTLDISDNDELTVEGFLGEMVYSRQASESISLEGQISGLLLDGFVGLSLE